jgi:lysophospholipase L1-like esterase
MKRRIIAALAGVALAAIACFGTGTAALADDPTGAPYVAVGDSIAAGTGNLPYVDTGCLRSKKAYPALLAAALGTSVTSAACAGASTADVSTQLAALAGAGAIGPATRLVTVTAGVNNFAWQNVLLICASGDEQACNAAVLAFAASTDLGSLAQNTGAMVAAIRAAAPNAMIVVTGYPLLFGQVSGSCSIGSYQGVPVRVSAQLAFNVNAFLGTVDSLIGQGVAGYQAAVPQDGGVRFVDVTAAFAGHALCDTGSRWINGLSSGQKSDGAFHPNAPGQQAYATTIAAALAP